MPNFLLICVHVHLQLYTYVRGHSVLSGWLSKMESSAIMFFLIHFLVFKRWCNPKNIEKDGKSIIFSECCQMWLIIILVVSSSPCLWLVVGLSPRNGKRHCTWWYSMTTTSHLSFYDLVIFCGGFKVADSTVSLENIGPKMNILDNAWNKMQKFVTVRMAGLKNAKPSPSRKLCHSIRKCTPLPSRGVPLY